MLAAWPFCISYWAALQLLLFEETVCSLQRQCAAVTAFHIYWFTTQQHVIPPFLHYKMQPYAKQSQSFQSLQARQQLGCTKQLSLQLHGRQSGVKQAKTQKRSSQPSQLLLKSQSMLSSNCIIWFGSYSPHHSAQGTRYDLQTTSQKETHPSRQIQLCSMRKGKKANYKRGGRQGGFFMCSTPSSTVWHFMDLINRHGQYLLNVSFTVTIHYHLGSNRFKTRVK